MQDDPLPPEGPYDCTACGACCVEAGKVEIKPEDDLPAWLQSNGYVAKHMGGRCKALTGVIGDCVGCAIYEIRPAVCASFLPGSEGCKDSRSRSSYAMRSTWRRRGYGENWQETV